MGRRSRVGYGAAVDARHSWPREPVLSSHRLDLEPQLVAHAAELAPVLDDPAMHTFVGGRPATVDELTARFEQQAVGHSRDGTQIWRNWTVRERASLRAVGSVQATIDVASRAATVAWVIGPAHQGRGFATEAARTMSRWLRASGATVLVAYVHPDHAVSMSVARALDLEASENTVDGEVEWTG